MSEVRCPIPQMVRVFANMVALESRERMRKKKKRLDDSILLKIENAKDKHISKNIIIALAQW